MQNQEHLNRYEWIVVLSLILLMAVLTWITHQQWFLDTPEALSQPLYTHEGKIYVFIEGAVEFPGSYQLDKGSTIENALALAKPTENADLKEMLLSKKMRDGQRIIVPKKEYIRIYLKEAVEHSGELIVPKGTMLEELPDLVHLKKGADIKKLQRKRKLKDGDVVKVLFEKQRKEEPSEGISSPI